MVVEMWIGAALASAAGSLGNRLISNLVKTPVERAQEQLAEAQFQRLAQEREHFRERMAFERNRFEAELKQREKQFDKAHQHNIEKIEAEATLRSWPLRILPHVIRTESSKRNHKAVNFIAVANFSNFLSEVPPDVTQIKRRSDRDTTSATANNSLRNLEHHQTTTGIDLYGLDSWITERYSETNSSHPILQYIVPTPSPYTEGLPPTIVGAILRASLPYEPTIFMHLDMRAVDETVVHIELWGLTLDINQPQIGGSGSVDHVEIIRLKSKEMTDYGAFRLDQDLSIKMIIANFFDLAHLILRFDDLPMPVAHQVLDREFAARGGSSAKKFAFNEEIIEILVRSAPLDATEYAMKLALHFQMQVDLDASAKYFRMARDGIAREALIAVHEVEWHDTSMFSGVSTPTRCMSLVNQLRRVRAGYPSGFAPIEHVETLCESALSAPGNEGPLSREKEIQNAYDRLKKHLPD